LKNTTIKKQIIKMTNEKPQPQSQPQSSNSGNLQTVIDELAVDIVEICHIIDPNNNILDKYVEGYGFMGEEEYNEYLEKISQYIEEMNP
jgi:hypothetical protein